MSIDIAENLPTLQELLDSVNAEKAEAHAVAEHAIATVGKAVRHAKRMDTQLQDDEAAWTIEMLKDMVAARKAAQEAEEHLLRRALKTAALHPRTAAQITGLTVEELWSLC